MKILVGVKRVVDFKVKIRVKADGSGIETDQIKMSMNPFDEIALEEAIRIKEKGLASEVIVVSIGLEPCREILLNALAMGADRALLIKTDQAQEPIHVAHLLKVLIEKESPTLVILGKQAIDDDCNQAGQTLAALLDWGQGTFVSKCDIEGDQLRIAREVDTGLETLLLQLPAVITADLRLNKPRYLTLPNIMKAKNRPLTILTPEELGVTLTPHLTMLKIESPPQRAPGIKINNINELLNLLKQKDKVLA
ncbi:electron transfer flavoprotein subunit beta/FixA family protein [Coxiella endosymbiont of Ornithodoros amblus]|uniref:electron transfer flavoprotein subunit beta/FixA family protein n=1 Tax=Coxiella endosymbiont of Ornithodoros amblus TaxID=1656166 RepID=UPI00244E2677|nr:electron transfer flavoprotein subunit beta/FixA family protein [Coxiella endosymbiont of Ornithodoros amblus]MBW5802982.1 electron transfer flavoprotein subunit beta/FixA family protein [Coxiella endosymbiont of Ornithodoros amblus]